MMSTRDNLDYMIEPWSGKLKELRGSFDCGADDLNSWLKKQASQDIDKIACALFTALSPGKDHIAGFYTLSMYDNWGQTYTFDKMWISDRIVKCLSEIILVRPTFVKEQ